ncbi:hypothetical protein AVEN_56122-1 [Araneus ventricosus]|uniref:Uncharacterized protein n=1 Tax=Araneus ventricosus TaxID=182803 RepID=A0A4Y2U568_ARAVE|nr:hypothetical protein AVEN_56122-1 [Araneus ventricosus]
MTRGALLVVMESPAYDQFGDFVERKLIERLYSTDGGYMLELELSNLIERLYSTDGGYMLELNSKPKFRIMESTKQEIFIFGRI